MPQTLVSRILDQVIAQLATQPSLAAIPMERARLAEVSDMNRLVVTMSEQRAEEVFTGRTDVTMTVTVEAWHQGSPGHTEAQVEDRLSELGAEIAAVLGSDPTLAGLADDAEITETAIEIEGGDPVIGSVAVQVSVTTGHTRNDPFTRA